jgi:hypothetical protein
MKTPLDKDLNKIYESFNQNHNHLRQKMMASLLESSNQKKRTGQISHLLALTGDTIMNSRITKLAAAAVIIIAVIIVIDRSGGAPDMASTAFAQVRETFNNVPWIHLTLSMKDEEIGDSEFEYWLMPERKIVAGRSNSGAFWRNYLNRQRKIYESAANTLTIYYERGEFSNENEPPWNYLNTIFGPELLGDLSISQHTEESQGELLNIYELVGNEDNRSVHFRILTGIDDNLPRSLTVQTEDTEKQRSVFVQGTCQYPDNGPEDIYDLGVPKDVTVINNLPTMEAKELVDICRRYRENFSSYIIIVIGGDPSSVVSGVYVNYIDGNLAKAGRFFKYLHFSYGFMFVDRNLFEKEIEKDFDSFLDRTEHDDNHRPDSISLWDSKYRYLVRKGKEPSYRKERGLGNIRDIGGYAWPIVLPMGKIFEDEYSEQNNLIGLKAMESLFYFDPEHDYTCIRRNDGRLIRDVREMARTENGSWYPRRIELTLIERDIDGAEISRQVTNVETIFVKMVHEFPEDTFDPDNLPKTIE